MKSNIVIPSWEIVNTGESIKKFNFIPSLLSTIYLSIVVLYQIAFSYVYIFHKKDEFFSLVIDFFHTWYITEVIIFVVIWFLLYILLQPIAEWWIACMIEGYTKKDPLKSTLTYWISQWILNFLQLFELHNFMWLFRLLSIITFYFLLLRVFWQDYAISISVIMWIYMLFAMTINLLFAYTRFFIVFEKKHLFEAISLSTKMTLMNMEITVKLYYTLFLVYARVIVTIILFTVFSLIFSAIFAFLSTQQIFFTIWISSLIIILFFFIIFISHFNSVLEIFVDSLWYNAYIENKKNMPDEE